MLKFYQDNVYKKTILINEEALFIVWGSEYENCPYIRTICHPESHFPICTNLLVLLLKRTHKKDMKKYTFMNKYTENKKAKFYKSVVFI